MARKELRSQIVSRVPKFGNSVLGANAAQQLNRIPTNPGEAPKKLKIIC
jgi:hypothetical protein